MLSIERYSFFQRHKHIGAIHLFFLDKQPYLSLQLNACSFFLKVFLSNRSFFSLYLLVQRIDFQFLQTLCLLLSIVLLRSLCLRRTFQHPKLKYLGDTRRRILQFWPRATATKRENCWLNV